MCNLSTMGLGGRRVVPSPLAVATVARGSAHLVLIGVPIVLPILIVLA
jgi:hypothetical protein